MRSNVLKSLLLLLTVSAFTISCKKPKENACTVDCQNGGSCVNGQCECPDAWMGNACEIYYTEAYAGDYISADFNCGQGPGTQLSSVSVDPVNKDRILIGSLYADMTDRTHFNIPQQGSANYNGSGIINGSTMSLSYSGKISNVTVSCSGTFTRKP
jgi:hypothetical protein